MTAACRNPGGENELCEMCSYIWLMNEEIVLLQTFERESAFTVKREFAGSTPARPQFAHLKRMCVFTNITLKVAYAYRSILTRVC